MIYFFLVVGILIFFKYLQLPFGVFMHKIKLWIYWSCFRSSLFFIKHKTIILVFGIIGIVCFAQYLHLSAKVKEDQVKPSSYEFVITNCSWQEAYNACIANGGHLVTIETEAEFQKIVELINANISTEFMFYIGASRSTNSNEYFWIVSNQNSINISPHWLSGEPSFKDFDLNVEEYYVQLLYSYNLQEWVYNDVPNDLLTCVPAYSGKIGYICEYN